MRTVTFIASMLVSTAVWGQITAPDRLFSMFCVLPAGVGFNWINDAWVRQNFTGYNYIFEKLDPAEVTCSYPLQGRPTLEMRVSADASRAYSGGCYSLHEIGTFKHGQYCNETWQRAADNTYALTWISCLEDLNDIQVTVNGPIVITHTYAAFTVGPNRDSLSMFVGECEVLP